MRQATLPIRKTHIGQSGGQGFGMAELLSDPHIVGCAPC